MPLLIFQREYVLLGCKYLITQLHKYLSSYCMDLVLKNSLPIRYISNAWKWNRNLEICKSLNFRALLSTLLWDALEVLCCMEMEYYSYRFMSGVGTVSGCIKMYISGWIRGCMESDRNWAFTKIVSYANANLFPGGWLCQQYPWKYANLIFKDKTTDWKLIQHTNKLTYE